MSKWLPIRLCGWLAVFAVILSALCFIDYWRGLRSAGVIACASGFAVFAVLLGFAWFAGSAVTWAVRRQGLGTSLPATPARASGQVWPCPSCGQPARLVVCSAHRVATCVECLPSHDSAECSYIPVRAREAVAPATVAGARAG